MKSTEKKEKKEITYDDVAREIETISKKLATNKSTFEKLQKQKASLIEKSNALWLKKFFNSIGLPADANKTMSCEDAFAKVENFFKERGSSRVEVSSKNVDDLDNPVRMWGGAD